MIQKGKSNEMAACKRKKALGKSYWWNATGGAAGKGFRMKVVKADLSCVRTPNPLRRHWAALQKWNISSSQCQSSVPCVMENQSISYQRPAKGKRETQVPAASTLRLFKYLPNRKHPWMVCVISDGDIHGAGGSMCNGCCSARLGRWLAINIHFTVCLC